MEPVLDVLLEKHVLSPQSDEYQTVMFAGSYTRERVRLLLDILPTLGPRAFEAFVEGLRRARPHLADLLEKVSEEDVCEGLFLPPKPDIEVVRRVQRKLVQNFTQLGRSVKVVDQRRGCHGAAAPVGLDQLYVVMSSLNYGAHAKFQGKTKQSPSMTSGRSAGLKAGGDLASKTSASRCQDEFELTGVGQLFRTRDGGELVDSCLVVGRPGMGKTVLLLKVVVSWATGRTEELSKFEIVVLVDADQDAEALKCDTPVKMLRCVLQRRFELSNAQREEMEKYMEKNSRKVLVLLDSANKDGETWAKSEALAMLFQRRGLEDCTYLATSSPSLAYKFLRWCRQRLRLIGFNERRLSELLVRRLGEDGVGIAEELKEPTQQHLCQLMKGTPLNANIVSELAAENEASVCLPSSSTFIYKALAANMVRRQERKVSGPEEFERSEGRDMFTCLRNGVKARLEMLGHMALDGLRGLRKGKPEFDMEEVQDRCGKEVIAYGFVEDLGKGESPSMGTYHKAEFCHLDLSKFFAAFALSRLKSPLSKIASCVKEMNVDTETALFWKFVCGLVDLKHLREILECLQAAFFKQHSTGELEKRQWVRLACSCVAEAVQQLSSDESVDEKRVFLEEACAAVIPRMVDVQNSRLSVTDTQVMSIALIHSLHVYSLDVSRCGLKAEHCKALGSGLTHIQELRIDGNPGLHDDRGLDMLAKVIVDCGAPQLTLLNAQDNGLDIDDCAAIRLLLNTVASLRELFMGCNYLGTAGLSKLQEPLSNSNLEHLDVENNNLDSRAGHILADIVGVNERLKYLF